MSFARPFAYNTGSTISGTEQLGDLAIGVDDLDYTGGVGGVTAAPFKNLNGHKK